MGVSVNFLGILFLSLLIHVYLTYCEEETVIELNDDNFFKETKARDWSLVLFHRNWCTRSKNIIKEFVKAANFSVKDQIPILWAKLDCETVGLKTCEKFSVSQVPVLFLFKNGNYFKEFLDKPDYVGIMRFAKAETGPGFTSIDNEQNKEIFFSGREVKLVGSFKTEETTLKKTFLRLVDEWKHQFDFGINSQPTSDEEEIILFRPKHLDNTLENSIVKYTGSDDAEQLENWIFANKHGLVGHRHKYNLNDFKDPLVVVYYEMDYDRAPKLTHYWRNRVLKVAKSYPDYTFAVSAIKDFNKEVINFGHNFMRPAINPLACAYIKNKRYPMKEDFSTEAFERFMEDLKTGQVAPHMRSEEPPETNDGPVKIAVARNFDEIVTESGKDTLIEFYAPWCTWCKRLSPVWEQLGKAMQEENVDIVKYNAENNEIPLEYEVNGYPTLFWVPKNFKNSPVLYQGGKEFDDFISYISSHATEELKSYDRQGKPKMIQEDQIKEEL